MPADSNGRKEDKCDVNRTFMLKATIDNFALLLFEIAISHYFVKVQYICNFHLNKTEMRISDPWPVSNYFHDNLWWLFMTTYICTICENGCLDKWYFIMICVILSYYVNNYQNVFKSVINYQNVFICKQTILTMINKQLTWH